MMIFGPTLFLPLLIALSPSFGIFPGQSTWILEISADDLHLELLNSQRKQAHVHTPQRPLH